MDSMNIEQFQLNSYFSINTKQGIGYAKWRNINQQAKYSFLFDTKGKREKVLSKIYIFWRKTRRGFCQQKWYN